MGSLLWVPFTKKCVFGHHGPHGPYGTLGPFGPYGTYGALGPFGKGMVVQKMHCIFGKSMVVQRMHGSSENACCIIFCLLLSFLPAAFFFAWSFGCNSNDGGLYEASAGPGPQAPGPGPGPGPGLVNHDETTSVPNGLRPQPISCTQEKINA